MASQAGASEGSSRQRVPGRQFPASGLRKAVPRQQCAATIFSVPDSSAPDSSAPDSSPDSSTPGEFASRHAESRCATLAQELTYKVEEPDRVIKNRSSVRLEYEDFSRTSVQLDGKAIEF